MITKADKGDAVVIIDKKKLYQRSRIPTGKQG